MRGGAAGAPHKGPLESKGPMSLSCTTMYMAAIDQYIIGILKIPNGKHYEFFCPFEACM